MTKHRADATTATNSINLLFHIISTLNLSLRVVYPVTNLELNGLSIIRVFVQNNKGVAVISDNALKMDPTVKQIQQLTSSGLEA